MCKRTEAVSVRSSRPCPPAEAAARCRGKCPTSCVSPRHGSPSQNAQTASSVTPPILLSADGQAPPIVGYMSPPTPSPLRPVPSNAVSSAATPPSRTGSRERKRPPPRLSASFGNARHRAFLWQKAYSPWPQKQLFRLLPLYFAKTPKLASRHDQIVFQPFSDSDP